MALTPEQLKLTLAHLGLEQQPPTLAYLNKLMIYFTARIPFENFAIHYSISHKIRIDVPHVFDKIVQQSRGGYCMELNTLFAALMRSLGYSLYTIGGRVRAGQPEYTATSHMTVVTTIDSQKYIVDVGFGGDMPLQVMPMIPHEFSMPLNRSGKLEHRPLFFNTVPGQDLWVYSVKDWASNEWKEQYALSEMELIQKDYELMNHFTSTSPDTIFTKSIVAARTVLEGDQVVCMYTLYQDTLRRRNNDGSKDEVAKFTTETERVGALEKYFGVMLSDEDQQAIQGTILALHM